MTRTILATATVLLMAPTLYSSSRAACISCEYVPEVVRGSRTSDQPAYSREYSPVHVRERAVEREHRAIPARRVKREVETTDTSPIKAQVENENSSISLGAEGATTTTAKADPKPAEKENSSITFSLTEATAKTTIATTTESASKPGDCKKFFPSVGLTLTVPCE